MSNITFFNDSWVEDAPLFSFNDRLRIGDGIFDTMLVVVKNGEATLIYPDLHFQRLLTDIKLLEIEPLPSLSKLTETAQELCNKNNLGDGRYALNTLITRGIGERGLMPPLEMTPSVAMHITPLPDEFPPITAITARRSYRNEGSPLSQIKSTNYGDNILVLIEARNKGANEAIMLNNSGNIACTTSGNIFVIVGGIPYTPPLSDGVLDGITRHLLMQKYDVMECSISMQDLQKSEGIYITNSVRGCMPVTKLNGQDVPEPIIKIDQDFHLK